LTYSVTPALELVACVVGDPYPIVLRVWRDQKWTSLSASAAVLNATLDEIAQIAPRAVEVRSVPPDNVKLFDLMATGANSWWHLDPRSRP
jgi:hypothetical protein